MKLKLRDFEIKQVSHVAKLLTRSYQTTVQSRIITSSIRKKMLLKTQRNSTHYLSLDVLTVKIRQMSLKIIRKLWMLHKQPLEDWNSWKEKKKSTDAIHVVFADIYRQSEDTHITPEKDNSDDTKIFQALVHTLQEEAFKVDDGRNIPGQAGTSEQNIFGLDASVLKKICAPIRGCLHGSMCPEDSYWATSRKALLKSLPWTIQHQQIWKIVQV